jgi:hypothetical protein
LWNKIIQVPKTHLERHHLNFFLRFPSFLKIFPNFEILSIWCINPAQMVNCKQNRRYKFQFLVWLTVFFFALNVFLLSTHEIWKVLKKKSVRHAAGRPDVGQNLYRRYLSHLKGYRFEISATFCQLCSIETPHTQKFEILKSLEQTHESKKFKSVLKFL